MKNLTKSLFVLVLIALLPVQAKAIQAGDTVSIVYSGYYLAVTTNGSGTPNGTTRVSADSPTRNCLWVVEANGSSYYFRSLVNSSYYLKVPDSDGGTITVTKGTDKSSLTPGTTTDFKSGSTATSASTKLYTKKAGIRYRSSSSYWRSETSTGSYSSLTINKWTKDVSTKLVGPTVSKTQLSFAYNATGSNNFTVDYSIEVNDKIVNLANKNRYVGTTTTITNVNTMQSEYGITCEIITPNPSIEQLTYNTTSGTGKKTVTVSPDTNSVVTGSTMLEEYVYVQIAKDPSSKVTTTSQQEEQKVVTIVRHAYEQRALDQLRLEIDPSTHSFAYNGIGNTFIYTVNAIHELGEATYIDGEMSASNIPSVEDVPSAQINLATNGTVSLFDGAGMNITWASISSVSGNQITVVCTDTNKLSTMREATLGVSFRYTCSNGYSHTAVNQASVKQKTQFSDAGQVLEHQRGVTNRPLNARGEQDVHEVYKTLYYIPNTAGSSLGSSSKTVRLQLKEYDFRGWLRWYDYDTQRDVSAMYTQNPESHDTKWSSAPSSFTVIGEGEYSQGRYKASTYVSAIPSIYSYTDGLVHHIACDVSQYTDYSITSSKIIEPTLSYREIFELRPASEMAAKMAECTTGSGKFVEDYVMIAPAGRTIYLTPEYPYVNGNETECCYIYLNDGTYTRVRGTGSGADKVHWYQRKADGTYTQLSDNNIDTNTDFMELSAHTMSKSGNDVCDTVVYELRTSTYNICRYTVIYQPQAVVGPLKETSNNGTWAGGVITKEDMYAHYNVIDSMAFNYDIPSSSSNMVYYPTPLPWEESACGFTYRESDVTDNRNRSGNASNFPIFGEYAFLNRVNTISNANYFTPTEQHGGAANGYMMYVDGTQNPGKFASLSVKGHLCSGQQMFCCAWIANIGNTSSDDLGWPKFRFDVEGKDDGETEWHAVASYTPGALNSSSDYVGKWFQINFGIDLNEDYDNYRISAYNFASIHKGNDFAIDDIYIYASRPPLVAYQATTNCQSTSEDIQVVLRLDYGGLAGDEWSNKYIYYDILNETTDTTVYLKPYPLGYANNPTNPYGKVMVPSKSYDPVGDTNVLDLRSNYTNGYASLLQDYIVTNHSVPEALVFNNIKELMDTHNNDSSYYYMNGSDTVSMSKYVMKGFVEETMGDDERYVIYTIHDATMKAENSYSVRMSGDPNQLDSALCALKTAIPVSNKVVIEVNGDLQIQTTPLELCANDMYNVGMRVFDIQYDIHTGTADTVTGHCFDDWLIAPVYADTCTGNAEQIAACKAERLKTKDIDVTDATCQSYYGYKYDDIITAITYDMRRTEAGNTNLNAATLADLDPQAFLSTENYNIIVDLVEKGKLLLYETEKEILMPAGAPDVAYVVIPIMGTATQLGSNAPMDLCTDPVFVHLAVGNPSDYDINIGKVPADSLPKILQNKAPVIRASQADARSSVSFKLQLMRNVVFGDTITVESSNDPDYTGDKWFGYKPGILYKTDGGDNKDYYKPGVNDTVTINALTAAPSGKTLYQLKQGYKYMLRIPLKSESGQQQLQDGCLIGSIFVELYIIPEYVQWKPGKTQDNNWNNDDNWQIVDADGNPLPGQGFVPMGHTNVIIESVDANEGDTTSYPALVPYSELERNKELVTYDFNYEATHCKNILFRDHAMLRNQHLLRYEKAYVDAVLPGAYWTLVSSPIEGVVSGDMFTPQPTGTPDDIWELTTYGNSGGHRNFNDPYCYWMSIYDETTNLYNMSQEQDGNIVYSESYKQSGWSKLANDVAHPFVLGDAVAILGYGPNSEYGEECNVRLPKRDTQYGYYREDSGEAYGASTTINRPANYNKGNLAFKKDTTITLTNQTAGNYFVFGNPAMSYIDMNKFFEVNTNFSTSFYTLYQNGWAAVDCSNERTVVDANSGNYFLEPLHGVMLKYNGTATKTVTVRVTTDMLTLAGFDRKASTSTVAKAPKRLMEISLASCLNITAETEDATSKLAIWEDPKGTDAYKEGEDSELMLSGMTSFSGSNVNTPLAIYTIEDDHLLSIDVRNKLTTIPLAFVDLYEAKEVDLWFDGASTFDYPIYLVDMMTDERWQVSDGTHLHLFMPQDGSVRYYLQAENHNTPDGPATSIQTVSAGDNDGNKVDFISYRPGQVTVVSESNISSIECFDLAGRLIRTVATATGSKNLVNINLPQGVALVRVNNEKGSVTGKLLIK